MSETTLHTCRLDHTDLPAAVNAFAAATSAPAETVALLMSPRRCVFARVTAAGGLTGPGGQEAELDLASVFEARVFHQAAELRWRLRSGREGEAVLLSETPVSGLKAPTSTPAIDTFKQSYLLWGQGTAPETGDGLSDVSQWGILSAARIGRLPVPVPGLGDNSRRVKLHSIEYVVEGAHGNAIVRDERLVKLEVGHGRRH